MRCAALVMILVLSGCSEWSLRSMIRSNAMGPDTADTGLGGPGGPDTAPPDDEGPGGGLPTHCSAADNPPMKPVWNQGEGPGNSDFPSFGTGSIDFDAQGRLLWVNQGKLNWADRSGNHGILDPEGDYLWHASIKVLPNGGLVAAGRNRILVRNPDTAETMRTVDGNLGERFRYGDTLEVDSENHFYTEYDFGSILRIPSRPAKSGNAEEVLPRGWRPELQWIDTLHLALTPDERILYILEPARFNEELQSATKLHRSERKEDGWGAFELVWEREPGAGHGDVAVDECGNAIILLSERWLPGGGYADGSLQLWYVPLKGV